MNMRSVTSNAFTDLDSLQSAREKRAQELKKQGKLVVGYFCCFVPTEIMTALDIVPYRIQGNIAKSIVDADAYLDITTCPYLRSCFDLALNGGYEFLDGLVMPHSCYNLRRVYDIWRHYHNPGFFHLINVPHMVDSSSYQFFKRELETFVTSLEKFTRRQLKKGRLRQAIHLHNENRSLLRRLYGLRKKSPPLVSGVEITKVLIAGMGMPVIEHNALVERLISEIEKRHNPLTKVNARILLYGHEIDDTAFIELIEGCGAHVVIDDICTGSRYFWQYVKPTDDLLESLANRYLEGIPCPRTYKPRAETRDKDLENRFGYLWNFIKEFNVNGAIFYVMRYCDTIQLDVPDARDYLQKKGIRVLVLENEYRLTSMTRFRTQIQAFIEILG